MASFVQNLRESGDPIKILLFRSEEPLECTQGYSGQVSHQEDKFALDFRMPVGTPVLAARDGICVDHTFLNTF